MKSLIAAAAFVALAATAMPQQAQAIGCLSGAAAGGVAGHYAGHHGILGAAAGCAVGHHMNSVQRRRAAAGQYSNQNGYSGQNGYSNQTGTPAYQQQ